MKIDHTGALSSAFLYTAIITALEPVAYPLSQIDDTNLLCTVDPTCAQLNDEQRERAKVLFADTIDYDRVLNFSRGHINYPFDLLAGKTNFKASQYVIGNYIYRGPQYGKAHSEEQRVEWEIHELTHIWQTQNNTPFGESKLYKYSIDEHESFFDFGQEQQAEIVEDIYWQRKYLEETIEAIILETNTPDDVTIAGKLIDLICNPLNDLENMASQALPIETTDCEEFKAQIPEI